MSRLHKHLFYRLDDTAKLTILLKMLAEQAIEECQLWPGTIDAKGYGRLRYGGRWRRVPALLDELANGPLLDGQTLDHWRMNVGEPCARACVNLHHLERVSTAVNTLRGKGVCAKHAAQFTCKRGHLLAGDNLRASAAKIGQRECLACRRLRETKAYRDDVAKEKEAQKSPVHLQASLSVESRQASSGVPGSAKGDA